MVIDDERDLVVEECQLQRLLHNGSQGVVVEYKQKDDRTSPRGSPCLSGAESLLSSLIWTLTVRFGRTSDS